MLAELIAWDQQLFTTINGGWHSPFLDQIFPIWREKTTWIPLYLLILVSLIYKRKSKVWQPLLLLGLGLLLFDTFSSQLLKKNVMRLRPCRTASLQEELHLLVTCGSGYSFTSSHATNHFGLAYLFAQLLSSDYKAYKTYFWLGFLLWAFSIAYGQLYVGVHFPLDLLCGAFLGLSLSAVLYWGYKRLGWG